MIVDMAIHGVVGRMTGVSIIHLEWVCVPVSSGASFEGVGLGSFDIGIVEA